jgi:hypothetical protein
MPRAASVVECLLAAALLAGTSSAVAAGSQAHVRWEHHHPLPDRSATPGRVFHHAGPRKFCHAGYTARVRSVSDSTRRKVFAEYGIAYAKHSHYELDHLIPLELGGSNGIRNLWPEKGSIPNAKDGVENELHNLVCQHKLRTRKARHVIAADWVKAMHKYGRSASVYDRPGGSGGGSGGSGGGGKHHACTRTSSGSCIRGGEFCPQASYGDSGWDANGHRWVCKGNHSRPHWERP